jgi:hypothetical protein
VTDKGKYRIGHFASHDFGKRGSTFGSDPEKRGGVISMVVHDSKAGKFVHGERLRPAGCGRHPAGRGFSRRISK